MAEGILSPIRKSGDAPLLSDNKLKLMVFGPNAKGGCTMTSAEGTVRAEWDESRRIARLVEASGIEGLIPYVRFKGLGGATNPGGRSFETTTWAAGLSEATERIQVFTTALMPSVHPVMLAKQLATVDHISDGRAALNIVAGWFSQEFRLFGAREMLPHAERYAHADEWLTIVKRLWTEDEPFTFEGKYFQVYDAVSDPKPIQQPFPILMSAGSSAAGRRFAAKHCDINFVVVPDLESAPDLIREVKEKARAEFNRDVLVFGMGSIVCRDTERAAREYVDYYINQLGDWSAASNMANDLGAYSESMTPGAWDGMRSAIIRGFSALPLIGTAEQVVDGMVAMSAAGFDGITLNWPNYEDGLVQFREQILPLAVETGIRTDQPY